MPEARIETITPARAEELLTRNTGNRPLRAGLAERYATVIRRGEWQLNGETIKVAADGRILDGQHRLWAVVVAEMPIETYIVYGLNPAVFTTIDRGAKRSTADALAVRGETTVRTLAASAAYVWRHDNNLWLGYQHTRHAPSAEALMELIDAEPALREHVKMATSWSKRSVGIPSGLLGGLWHILARIDAESADVFFDRLASGVSLEDGSPILALRRWLTTYRTGQHKTEPTQIAARVFIAWNAYRTDRQIQYVRWSMASKAATEFPRPI